MYKNSIGKWTADLGNGMYKNPILFADYSDPDVIRVDDDFFMVSSSFTYFPGMPVLHSKDLVNWKVVSYAVNSLPFSYYDVPQHGKGVWAPSIRYHAGKFWVFFGTPDEGIFMANTEDPFGKWNDVVCIKEAKGWIDPCPLWDDDGNAYLVHAFAKSRCGFKSILHVNTMSADGTKILDDGVKVFDGRINHPTIEGPKFYKRNGYYYIMAPAGGVRTGWQTVLRSKSVFGPYEHKVVMHQGDTPINGPHQGGWIELKNGQNWFIHFQDIDAYGRVTHLQPMQWINDWPLIGIDNNKDFVGEPVLEYKKPDINIQSNICTPDTSDYFKDNKLGIQWQWQAHANKKFYHISNEMLRLFAYSIESEDGLIYAAPNMLSQLMQAPNFEVATKINLNLVSDGDTAGINITGGNYYCIRAEKNGSKLFIKQANFEYENKNLQQEHISKFKEIENVDTIFLKIKVTYNGLMDFYYSFDDKEYNKLGETITYNVSRKSWVGGRVGIFCVNMKHIQSQGYADFEYVEFI